MYGYYQCSNINRLLVPWFYCAQWKEVLHHPGERGGKCQWVKKGKASPHFNNWAYFWQRPRQCARSQRRAPGTMACVHSIVGTYFSPSTDTPTALATLSTATYRTRLNGWKFFGVPILAHHMESWNGPWRRRRRGQQGKNVLKFAM